MIATMYSLTVLVIPPLDTTMRMLGAPFMHLQAMGIDHMYMKISFLFGGQNASV